MSVTFTKLPNGSYGLRATDILKTGTVATVTRKDGKTVPIPVGKWLRTCGNPAVHIYEQGDALPAPENQDEEAPGEMREPAPVKPTKSQLWARAKSEVGGSGALAEDLYRQLLDEHGYVPEPKPAVVVTTTETTTTTLIAPSPVTESNGHTNGMPSGDVLAIANGLIGREKVVGTVTSHDETKLRALDQATRTFTKDVYHVFYDMVRVYDDGVNPDGSVKKVKQTDLPDPAAALWEFGIPFTQSVWVMTEEQLQSPKMQNLLKSWDRWAKGNKHGAPEWMEYHITPVHPRAIATMRDIAADRLATMLREVHTSLITRIDNAHAAWQLAQVEFDKAEKTTTWQERQKAEASRCNKIRAVIREAADDLNNAIRRAEDFDERGGIEDLISGLRLAIRSSVNSFNAHAATKNVAKVHVKV